MARTIVGVLRGGTSSEYDLSLKTGAAMLQALPEELYDTRDILIDKRGYWHLRGMPVEPARALSQVDVVVNGLHGGVGEDGTVQRILQQTGIPFAGSRAPFSALSLHKIRAREAMEHAGIRMPRALWFSAARGVDTREMARMVFSEFGPPYLLKPASEGASHGIVIAPSIADLPFTLADILERFRSVLVEEYLAGEDATVGVIEDFRGEDLYALPPVHIILPDNAMILHFAHHLEGGHRHVVPSDFSAEDKRELIEMAQQAHRALGLSHYSRADFIVTRRGPYLLEVNSLPGLHEHASFPHMLESVGSSVKGFLEHAIQLARR